MNKPTAFLTGGEQAFLSHFNAETFNQRLGPAISWLNSQELHWNLMAGFQRWMVTHDPSFMEKIEHEEQLPPFEVPWSSREELMDRVQEFLEVYPDLRPLIRPHLKVEISA
jgi:hypothetical protein